MMALKAVGPAEDEIEDYKAAIETPALLALDALYADYLALVTPSSGVQIERLYEI